jgi:hypothetical protein
MPETLIMAGSLFKVGIDREGEAKITFCFPLTEINKVAEISKLTEKLLKISVEEVIEG